MIVSVHKKSIPFSDSNTILGANSHTLAAGYIALMFIVKLLPREDILDLK